jgi:hypothetical protein
MKSIHWPKVLVLLYIFSLAYCLYIGVYETIYSLGIYIVIAFQCIGLIIFSIHLLVRKFILKGTFNLHKSLRFSIIFLISIQTLWIVTHRIEKYKPTYTISIPEAYIGYVYLFNSPGERKDITVNMKGIGYIGSEGKAQWRIVREGVDITAAYSTQQTNEINLYDEDSLQLTAYRVGCIVINDSNYYPKRNWDYAAFPCLDVEEFLQLVEEGYIDKSKLRKKVWQRSKNGGWE